MSQQDFNALARRLPVLVNMRPFGEYSMVDVDAAGGLQVIVKELLDAGFLDGSALTCTGETLAEQVARLAPPAPDHEVIYSVEKPFKDTGGLRLLHGNLAPDGGAILKVAGVEGGVTDGVFTGRARVFNGERDLIEALDHHPDTFADNDMVVIRYAGPRGAPGMPELLDPTSRIHRALPPAQHHHRPHDRRSASSGRLGRAGHRPRGSPRRFLGGPIALVEDGDTIVVDVNTDRIDCTAAGRPRRGGTAGAPPGRRRWRPTAASTPMSRRSRIGCSPECGPRHCRPSSAGAWPPSRADPGALSRAWPCHNVGLMQERSSRPEILVLVT